MSQKTSRTDPETGQEVWHEYNGSGELVNFSDLETAWSVLFPEDTRDLYKHVGQWSYRREAFPRTNLWQRVDTFVPRGDPDDPAAFERFMEWRRQMFGAEGVAEHNNR